MPHEAGPPPSTSAGRAPPAVPRVFQALLIAYILLTGELVRGLQAALFGLQGGGDAAFTIAILLAIAVDIARIAPLVAYARHPLGILHPLILTVLLWPLLVAMPRTIDELGGLGGLLLGEQVTPPYYAGLGWAPGPDIWVAVAWSNLCALLALLATYAGFAFARERTPPNDQLWRPRIAFDGKRLRALAVGLIAASLAILLLLIAMRGGLALHFADMARGRFRSMAGLGPLVAAVDLGLVAIIVWVAARPEDARRPLFIVSMLLVAAAQFMSNGARSAAFAAFIMVGLAWALRTRRIPWRLALIMVPAFFLAFGALNIIRTAGFGGEGAGQAIEAADTSDMLSRVEEEIELRRSLESTVPVISQGQELMGGPLLGSSYAAAVFAFVPRWIWPEKPRGAGSLYAQNFLGEVREGLTVPVNSVAEAHWNFGILGVILLFLLYGAIIRRAHHFYIVRHDNPFAIAAFVLFVTAFHLSTDDLVLFQQQTALLLLTLGLAIPFAARARRAPEIRPATPSRIVGPA